MISTSRSAPETPRRPKRRGRRFAVILAGVLMVGALLVVQVATSQHSVLPAWAADAVYKLVLRVPNERLQALVPEQQPRQPAIHTVRWLEQGWSNAERFWFHHASQGTTLPIPYDWLVALQQPGLTFTGTSSLLGDPEYLRQFGFVTSPRTLQTSAERLRSRYGYSDEEIRRRVTQAMQSHALKLYMNTRGGAAAEAMSIAVELLRKEVPRGTTLAEAELAEQQEQVKNGLLVAVMVFVLDQMQVLGIEEIDGINIPPPERVRIKAGLDEEAAAPLKPLIKKAADDIVSEVYGDLTSRQMPTTSIPPNLQRRMPENIDGLPVGFARTPGFIHPATGRQMPDQVGFTCAVCHTGEITYKGTSIRIDGGAANVNLLAFQKAFVQAMVYTQKVPGRFTRFAERVLGTNHTDSQRAQLRREFDTTVAEILAAKELQDATLADRRERHVDEGFGRLDALNRIGNQVFFTNLMAAGKPEGKPLAEWLAGLKPSTAAPSGVREESRKTLGFDIGQNFERHSAPVSFPPIWNTSWHLWAQYDASIMQPVIRNLGEALGVAAIVNITSRPPETAPGAEPPAGTTALRPLYRSSVDLEDLHHIEKQLAGKDPFPDKETSETANPDKSGGKPGFKGLQAPRWADAARLFDGTPHDSAWHINTAKVAAGRRVYAEICAECHLPPVRDPDYKPLIDELNKAGARPTLYELWDERTIYGTQVGKNPKGEPVHDYTYGFPGRPALMPHDDAGGTRTPAPAYWLQLKNNRYLDVVQKPAADMGTDLALSTVLHKRDIKLPAYLEVTPDQDMNQWGCRQDLARKSTEMEFGLALMAVVDKVSQQWIRDRFKYEGWGDKQKATLEEWIGPRPSCPNALLFREVGRAGEMKPQYRARSLDGIWATAPYLHNGSVPSLWSLLSPYPDKDRPTAFCTGSKEFDPTRVGLDTTCAPGTIKLDTSIPGNSRMGHELRGQSKPRQVPEKGVVGRGLSDDERWAIIEYLKTL